MMTLVDKVKVMDEVKELLRMIKTSAVQGVDKIRIGGNKDGGYVMLEPGRDGLAISLGVSDYSPWDLEMAKRGFVVHQYDGSIENNPDTHPNIFFHKQFVDASQQPAPGTASIADIFAASQIDRYENVILQIDI
ncbi:MAG: hypothetical protein LIP23_07230 [Planctomycetes bacterium]|nr:hypothetical protein [Planctomycetota bacterium]